MQEILDAILDPASQPADFAVLPLPEAYRAVTLHRDEEHMFDGIDTRDQDPRKSLHIEEVPVPELGLGEALVAVMASSDGADSAWPARAIGAGSGRVSAREKVSMPAQRRLWPHQQPEPAKHVLWEPVQQGGQERPVAGEEPRPGLAQLSLQDRDLVT